MGRAALSRMMIRMIGSGEYPVLRHHISVCICTYKRPESLLQLTLELEKQDTEDLFDYSIVVVDNDRFETARQAMESYAQQARIPARYCVEPEQNIALARNKAVENAAGDFIAFIDDDEFPAEQWLLNLYKAWKQYKSDGILGPVLPYFEREPPKWVLKGRFFERPTHPTGHVLEWKNTRTGNALLKRELFKEGREWFDPAFGSGGEDRNFFKRKIGEGHVFAWCNEAPVFEAVSWKRWNRTVMLKRALLRGKMAFNAAESRALSVLSSVVAIAVYTVCLPVFFLLGQHVFMKYLIKNCDHLGKVLAFLGIDLVKEKYLGG
jgi:glycosyltransferase involved in cell wall biosynthesis